MLSNPCRCVIQVHALQCLMLRCTLTSEIHLSRSACCFTTLTGGHSDVISVWEHWRAGGRGRFTVAGGSRGGCRSPLWRGFGGGAPKIWRTWRLLILVCLNKIAFCTHFLSSDIFPSIPTQMQATGSCHGNIGQLQSGDGCQLCAAICKVRILLCDMV